MNQWKVVTYRYQAEDIGKSEQLQELFMQTLLAKGGARDAAIFANRSPDKTLYQCYLTPSAAAMLAPFLIGLSPEDCGPPEKNDLSLLVAVDQEAAWELLN